MRWGFKIYFHFYNRKYKAIFRKFGYQKPMLAKKLRPGTFQIFDVIGVIDNTGCISIFVINSNVHPLAQPQVDCFGNSAVAVFQL